MFRNTNYTNRGKDAKCSQQELIEKCKGVQKLLEGNKGQFDRVSPEKESILTKFANLSKKLGAKNENIHKVEVFLASQENVDNNPSTISFK
jgi:hypothetical protein